MTVLSTEPSLRALDGKHTQADQERDGRFGAKVSEGPVQVLASLGNLFGHATAKAGDTNVVLRLYSTLRHDQSQARRTPLKGKSLPDVSALGLSTNVNATQGPLLLCLFDCQQRPSRRVLHSLAEEDDRLHSKNVTVLGVQAVPISAEAFRAWKQGKPVPIPMGCISEKTSTTAWVSDVESLPWLILTDAKGIVVDECFGLDELEAKLGALQR